MGKLLILTIVVSCFFACQGEGNDGSKEKSLAEIKAESSDITSIIRVPISADGTVDTVNVAKMVFEEVNYDFGAVKEGDVVNHTFKFTNTGTIPLLIAKATSTCGCTVPKWPKEPIKPGEDGVIKVKFDTKNKKNHQNKPVTILANTYPNKTVVNIKGFVQPKK